MIPGPSFFRLRRRRRVFRSPLSPPPPLSKLPPTPLLPFFYGKRAYVWSMEKYSRRIWLPVGDYQLLQTETPERKKNPENYDDELPENSKKRSGKMHVFEGQCLYVRIGWKSWKEKSPTHGNFPKKKSEVCHYTTLLYEVAAAGPEMWPQFLWRHFVTFIARGGRKKSRWHFRSLFFLPPSLSNHREPPGTSCAKKKANCIPNLLLPTKWSYVSYALFFSALVANFAQIRPFTSSNSNRGAGAPIVRTFSKNTLSFPVKWNRREKKEK